MAADAEPRRGISPGLGSNRVGGNGETDCNAQDSGNSAVKIRGAEDTRMHGRSLAGNEKRVRCFGRAGLGLTLLLVTNGATCTNRAPTSDATPPVVRWTVHNNVRGGTQELTGDAMVAGQAGDTFTVTLTVEDPEGVHRISLGQKATWTCLGAEGGARVPTRDRGTAEQDFEEDSNGRVWTRAVMVRRVSLREMICDSGYTLTEGAVTLEGTGENFFGGTAIGELRVHRGGP